MLPDTDQYAEWMLERGLSTCTVEQRVWFAEARHREWGGWDASALDVARWLSQWSGWTAITYHSHLRAMFEWLVDVGAVESSPMKSIRRPATPRPNPKPFGRTELERIFDGLEGDLRVQALLALLAGLRVHEVAKIRGEDVDEHSITVLGKGGKLAAIPTHAHLWEVAQTYPRRGYWFPDGSTHVPAHRISARIARRFRACGIEQGSIHRLRATYGTELARTTNLRVVQTLLRHSSLATTEYYLGVDADEQRAAIARLGLYESETPDPLAA